MDRRRFRKFGLFGAASSAFGQPTNAATFGDRSTQPKVPLRDRICLFTDHLDDFGYSYRDIAIHVIAVARLGTGSDSPSGRTRRPESSRRGIAQGGRSRDRGFAIPMISTGLTLASDAAAEPTFAAMQKLGIRYYKLGYYPYEELAHWRTTLESVRMQLSDLVRLGQQHNVRAGFHNHSGPVVGGALWDSWQILRQFDPKWIGFYFDPAQATIEGGKHGWKLNFQRLSRRLLMIAIKDFVWEKVGGEWRTRWCALGEGTVNWPEFVRQLSQVDFDGPISLHIEYDPGGKTRSARFENSLAAAERDLRFLRDRLDEVAA